MKAIGYTHFGGPEVLRVLELPEPHAGPGQVRVRVQAAAVSPADTAARSGWMKRNYAPETLPGGRYPEPPYVPGWDFCGVLDEAPDSSPLGPGQQVVGLALSPMGKVGAYAEYVVTDARSVVRAPTNATTVAASTLLMNAVTAYAMLEALAIPTGGTVAVTGAAGALGGYAVQLAKHGGLQVIADAADDDRELVQGLGADSVISRYIERRGEGMHHIAFAVSDIEAEMKRLSDAGFTLLNTTPKKGADNKLVCFLHPKNTNGVLVELCQEIGG